jgi:phage gp29-like protein
MKKTKAEAPASDIILKLAQEFQDRSRKDIQKWRSAITAAENPENPRWFLMQDLVDDIIIDAHLASVIGIRKAATLNHRFYVIDKVSKEHMEEQTDLLNRRWFYDLLDAALEAIVRKFTVMELFPYTDAAGQPCVKVDLIPRRNVCPQFRRIYNEASGDKYIDYSAYPNVLEVLHGSKFGLINDVAPNVIWKRNLLQSNAEFSERFGMPLITATTSQRSEVPRIDSGLKKLGESGTGVLPNGTEIKVHDLANAGNPEAVYLKPADYHDKQVSKRFLGSTTIVDEGANRAQTQVHQETLDDKIAQDDKRFITFIINDQLFPMLQSFGMPFDAAKMAFQFDETESLTLSKQWEITSSALQHYELDDAEVAKTFNLPIVGRQNAVGGPAGAPAAPPAKNPLPPKKGGGIAANFT